MENKTDFKISKRTIIWICILCAAMFAASIIIAQDVSSRYENTYSIETSKLHIYS